MKRTTVLVLLAACAHSSAERTLARLKTEVMTADYRADLAGLARLRDEALPLAASPEVGHLAHYWSAFSSWRIAINGASHGMAKEDLVANLQRARDGMEAATRARPDFADGYAAEASITGWLAGLHHTDQKDLLDQYAESNRLLGRARALAPDNPRVLWVVGGVYLFSPPAYGGDVARAIQTYQHMAEVAGTPGPSAAPDWGGPEAWMSLAYAHLQRAELDAATREARKALELRPDWSYVRDVLLPQIAAAAHR